MKATVMFPASCVMKTLIETTMTYCTAGSDWHEMERSGKWEVCMEKRKKRRRRAACTEEKKDERGIYFLFIFCGFQDPDSTLG